MIAKSGVVEREKREVARRVSRSTLAPTPPTIDRDRERQEEQRQQQLPRAAGDRHRRHERRRRRRSRCPRARRRRRSRRRSRRRRARRRGSATTSASDEERRVQRAPSPSQIALRSHGREHEPVEQPLCSRSATKRAREAEQRGEDDRDPEQPYAGELVLSRAAARSGRSTSAATTKSSIAGSVSRARSSQQQVLARQRGDVGEVPSHANARPPVASGSSRPGRASRRRRSRLPRSSASSRSSSAAPSSSSALNGSSRSSSSGSWSSARQSASRCSIPRENESCPLVACRPRDRTARAASRSAPARSGHAVQARRRGRGSRARSARGRRAARARGSRRCSRRRLDLELARRSATSSPATSRSSVVLPEPFGPGDEQEPAALDVEVEPVEDPLRRRSRRREAARADHERDVQRARRRRTRR